MSRIGHRRWHRPGPRHQPVLLLPSRRALHRTNSVWSIEQRALGYWAGLREAGIQPDDRLYEGSNLGAAGGHRGGQPFTATLCANDESAVGAMRALHQAG